jgi:glyoxylate reductase
MSLPSVIALAPAAPESFAPLAGLAEVRFPGDSTQFGEEQIRRFQKEHPVSGLIVPGEFPIVPALLEDLPDLQVIANTAAGYNNLPLAELSRRRIWGTNTPDAFTAATADATLGLILALARGIAAGDAYVRTGRWEQEGPQGDRWSGMGLSGKTLGIIGFGKIGQAVARRAEAFGMTVIFHRRGATGDSRQRDFARLLEESDVVVVLVPLSAETRHLIDARAFDLMRPGTRFVNVSRGPVVNEQDLVDALQSGRLAGAALDVFEAEPKVHPALLGMKQVVLTPHLGGATREARHQARIEAATNVAAALLGRRPPGALNQFD